MFHVGQKVVCIGEFRNEDAWVYDEMGVTLPVRGEVYTVREVRQELSDDDVACGLLLVEIVNPILPRHRSSKAGAFPVDDKGCLPDGETLFGAPGFRPLITVEDFTANDTPAPVPA